MVRSKWWLRGGGVGLLLAALSCVPQNTEPPLNEVVPPAVDPDSTSQPNNLLTPSSVADLASARPLPPVPSASVRVRLTNRLPRELTSDVLMVVDNADVRVERRAIAADADVLIGPDEADRIIVNTRTSTEPQIVFATQEFLLGSDFRPGDILELIYEDLAPPTITCPTDITTRCDGPRTPAALGAPRVSDDLSAEPTLSFFDTPGGGDCAAPIVRTWTATDESGNAASCTQRIRIVDDIPPTLTLPDDAVLGCLAQTPPLPISAAVVTDNCDPNPSLSVEEFVSGECPRVLERRWTARDACGNVTTATRRVIFEDRTPPLLVVAPEVRLPCVTRESLQTLLSAVATDECGPVAQLTFADGPARGCPARITRLYTARDECGNEATAAQEIVLEDGDAPLVVVPDDVSLPCGADTSPELLGFAVAVDVCDAAPAVSFADVVLPCVSQEEPARIERLWTARDACGNEASALQRIILIDLTPPVLSLPPDAGVPCGSDTSPEALGFATARDDCDAAPLITYLDLSLPTPDTALSGPCPQTIVRRWTARDGCGNETSADQVINLLVLDKPPVVICPEPAQLFCGESAAPDKTGQAEGFDSDGQPTEVFYEDTSRAGCPVGILRRWIAVDARGVQSEPCEQLIDFVQDETAPVLGDIQPTVFALCGDQIAPEIPVLICATPLPLSPVTELIIGDPHPSRVQKLFIAQAQIGDALLTPDAVQPTPTETPLTQPELLLIPGDSYTLPTITPRTESDFDWRIPATIDPLGPAQPDTFPLEITYDAFAEVVYFRVGRKELVDFFTLDPARLKDVLIRAQARVPGGSVDITELQLTTSFDGEPVPTIAELRSDTPEARSFVRFGCGALTSGFTLRGRIALRFDPATAAGAPPAPPPVGDQLLLQVIVGDYDEPPGTGIPSVSDDCTPVETLRQSLSYFDWGDYSCGGDVTRVWSATDECGNIGTLQQVIQIRPELTKK